jgi:2-dehydro-3-deoxygluconokinase
MLRKRWGLLESRAKVDVVTIGESMVLFQSVTEGSLTYSPLFMKSVAGAESNVAIGLSRLGKKVRWISRLGEDPFGDTIVATLAGEGIDVTFAMRDSKAPTAVYFKEVKGYGDPNVYYYRKNSAASLLTPDCIKSEWFEGARHLHVTGITPALGANTAEFIKEAMIVAREKGLSISFDPNLRRKLWSEEEAREVLLSMIPLCDIFLPGVEEAEFLIGAMSHEQYGERFLEMGPKVVALKLGSEGSIGFVKDQLFTSSPYKVKHIVDTVGAGDSFAAGLLSVILDENDPLCYSSLVKSLPKALQRANIVGALATQFKGDFDGAPTLKEVKQLTKGSQLVTR